MTIPASAARFDDRLTRVELVDGRILGVPPAWFPRLLHAAPEQRPRYEIGGGGRDLRWDELDEDISVAGLLAGRGDRATRLPDAA
ncbi:DUF2442 domain-containing protein [Benzoatithermus flavus]|uniref:DUF2442 domain-containing protein n=1 Tax=Benzoatithermus flavus TaxID=3108223 RepID=A0ABU8XR00_9PROT